MLVWSTDEPWKGLNPCASTTKIRYYLYLAKFRQEDYSPVIPFINLACCVICDIINKTLQHVSMNPAMCNFLQSVIKEMIGGQMEQLLLRQLTMRHIGFLLSAISFGFQVGEKYILGIIQCPILIISETCQLVRKLTICFILLNIFMEIWSLWKSTPKELLKNSAQKKSLHIPQRHRDMSNTWIWS